MLTSTLRRLAAHFGYSIKKRRSGIRRDTDGAVHRVLSENLMNAIHGQDIYQGFPYQDFGFDAHGWGGESAAFGELIDQIKPDLIIEVGSWKGASALTMAGFLEKQGKGQLLCIDTWLGALEFWEDQSDPQRFQALNAKHGYPQVYYQFLANICHQQQQSRVIPFPMTSASAALWLMRYSIQADLIYVDASHEEEDVYQDLIDYFELTRSGGVLFGDDWSWSGVRAAVERFASENRLKIQHLHDKWLLRKP
jgi:hypothetical protein